MPISMISYALTKHVTQVIFRAVWAAADERDDASGGAINAYLMSQSLFSYACCACMLHMHVHDDTMVCMHALSHV